MSPLPRALHRARLMTAGALTASTLLVGAIGIHLADTQTGAASTTGTTSSSSSSSSTSSDDSSSSSGSTSSDDSSSSDTSGFSAVAPVANGNGQAQTSSGGS